MPPSVLRENLDRRPFTPFTITVSTGERFMIRKPEFLFLGKQACLLIDQRAREFYPVQIAYMHVVKLEPVSGISRNGHPRRNANR